ncbi:Antibiotic biosynthesis monooxygenase [Variovorax sp. YR752]|uniref:antibiotic biosynthesis monooxygenase family protein n=1 Tax=unclassified Variovorax TaxID=663243 RepID=UPI000BDD6107|nr:antibiotic biosynthesis monooxygenase family protein [Variovorax sp. YR752]SOE06321.1 Antibiotic biosynthesis monooxygenase [Variovorax sp. YR752]
MFKPLIAAVTLALAGGARAQPVVLINPFEVSPGQEEVALRAWEQSAEFLAKQPGYRSTRLHRALLSNARFTFINVAEWDSMEAFEMATRAMQGERREPPPEGVKSNPALYQVIRN